MTFVSKLTGRQDNRGYVLIVESNERVLWFRFCSQKTGFQATFSSKINCFQEWNVYTV